MADDRVCAKCGKKFQYPSTLKAHQQRKTPCQPKIDNPVGKYVCKHCGRSFAFESGLYKHLGQSCKVAKAAKTAPLEPQLMNPQQVEEIVKKVMTQMTLTTQPPAPPAIVIPQTVNNNINTVINQQINIHPWGGDRSVRVPVEMIAAAFAENKQLIEFCDMGDHAMADYKQSGKFVIEAFMDLTKRAHQDPAARNIRLNPNRADQALVFGENAKWDACPINDATRIMFNSISDELKTAALPPDFNSELPPAVQNGASYVRMQYREQPEQYINDAKPLIVAHLSNITPARPK